MGTEMLPTRRSVMMTPTYLTGNLQDNGLYSVSTTKAFHYGQRYLTWNGRIFKYAYATTGGVESYHGARSTLDAALSMTAAPSTIALGSDYIIATLTGRNEDDLLGGQVVIYSGAAIDNTIQRDIVGNDASGASTTKVYLDAPLDVAVTITTDSYEIFENEYSSTCEPADGYSAWLGVPAKTAAATYNYWIQTWGRCLVSGGEAVDSPSANCRMLVWSGASAGVYKNATYTSGQFAGYILNQGSSSIAGPTIYLMCST